MKRLLLIIVLMCAVLAQESIADLTGCEDRGSYYLCPQTNPVEAGVQLTSDITCGYLGEEEEGCYATATIVSGGEYEDCKIYVPNPLTDVAGVQHDYQCTTKTIPGGTEVELLTVSQWAHDCETTDDQEFYHYDTCAMSGEAFDVKGAVSKEKGKYYLLAVTMQPKEGYVDPVILLAAAAAIIVGVWFVTRKKK